MHAVHGECDMRHAKYHVHHCHLLTFLYILGHCTEPNGTKNLFGYAPRAWRRQTRKRNPAPVWGAEMLDFCRN
jgi:hypothetical protein